MKKIIALVLVLASVFALCACGKPVVEVKITKDNFFDYFEYVEMPEYNVRIIKDSTGNLTRIIFNSGYYLKDGYTLAEKNWQDCKVEVGFKCDRQFFWNNSGITTDLENRSYTVTGKPGTTEKTDMMVSGWGFQETQGGPFSYSIIIGETHLSDGKDNDTYTLIISDLELVSASGTLYLYG